MISTLSRAFFLSAITLLHQLACAQADSVSAGKHRGSAVGNIWSEGTRGPAPAPTPAITTLLHRVDMKSQHGRVPQAFSYGPFVNRSTATLTITLSQLGLSGHRFAVGVVNDVVVIQGDQTATFDVPPGAEYRIGVQDSFTITAYGNQSGLTLEAAGLPTPADFDRPTGGVYLGCRTWINGTESYTGQSTLYYYEPGTRSDKSSRTDSIFPPQPPQSAGQCEEIVVDNNLPGPGGV